MSWSIRLAQIRCHQYLWLRLYYAGEGSLYHRIQSLFLVCFAHPKRYFLIITCCSQNWNKFEFGFTDSTKTKVQGRQEEQIEQRRSDQTTDNNDRHRPDDLVTGNIPEKHEGQEGQGGCQRGH